MPMILKFTRKTDFLLTGTKLQRKKFLNNFPCLIPGQVTNLTASAENILALVFDSSLNFRKHIGLLFHNMPEKDISLDYNAFRTVLQEW